MKSLFKTLDIIETIAENGRLGIREISTKTGFPPATIHRIATTLVKRRYFRQDPITKTYSLSFRFMELGTRVQEQFDLSAISRPHLQRLMTETEESANLAILDGDEVVYLEQVKNDKSILKIFTRLGARAPLYTTGVGKMFMSQWREAEIDAYLMRTHIESRTPNTLVNRDDIRKEMALISAKGYSVDNEEMETGVRCVAAPVFDHNRQPVAAVSISGAAIRITPDRIGFFEAKVRRCAMAISSELGYNAEKNQ
jgi:DNA-binding IclR family transcriptional regulator